MQLNLEKINSDFPLKKPEEIIRWAWQTFRHDLVTASSFGAESALMLDMATKIVPNIPVIFINTGYLFPETYLFVEKLSKRLSLNLKVYFSLISPREMENAYGKLWEKGEDGLRLYHLIRKIEPMKRALRELEARAVLYGVRAYQTENRSTLSHVELNPERVYKVHPLLGLTKKEVESYFTLHALPYHPLAEKGYDSIGDIHTTVPGRNREGRLLGPKMECGLHINDRKV